MISIARARMLRRNMTEAEKKLWRLLRSYQLGDYKFRRQHTVGSYIADFACVEVLLIVELDGGQHCENSSDIERTKWLEDNGWRVLRFWNNDVLQNIEGVWKTLDQHLRLSPLHRKYALPRKKSLIKNLSLMGEVDRPIGRAGEGEISGTLTPSPSRSYGTGPSLSHEGEGL